MQTMFRLPEENIIAQNLQVFNSNEQEDLVSTKISKENNLGAEKDENLEKENIESDYSVASSSINESEPQVETLSRLKKVVIKVNDEYEEKFVCFY